MARSLSFGSTALYFFALLRLAFASAPYFLLNLAQYHNSPAHSAKGTLSPFNGLELFVSIWFQILYFTPLPGFFSPFLHSTGSLSVDHEYLALEDGPPVFGQDVTCPALLFVFLVPCTGLRIRGCHPLWPAFPDRSAVTMHYQKLGCCGFARRYCRNLG